MEVLILLNVLDNVIPALPLELGLAVSVRFQGGAGFGSGVTTGGAGATTATGTTEASSGLDTSNSGWMDLEPAQGGWVSGDGSGGELGRGDGDRRIGAGHSLIGG